MGMGAVPCSADVISFENVEKLVPAEFKSLKTLLLQRKIGDAWSAFAYCAQYSFLDIEDVELQFCLESEIDDNAARELTTQLQDAWDRLTVAFDNKTGLTLSIYYYNEEDGVWDYRYDEHGCFFCVNGVWDRTPAGEKYKDYIQHCSWTVYC